MEAIACIELHHQLYLKSLLLELRNVIVRPFGLKTSIDVKPCHGQDELKPETAVGIFEVLNRRLDEIMLGEDDKSLNYRVSVQLEREEGKCWVIISTLETMFQRKVDLVDKRGLKNPYRRAEILKTHQVIYASNRDAAALWDMI